MRTRIGAALGALLFILAVGAPAAFATGNGGDKDHKVTICHVPPGNPGNAHTITISKKALKAHLGDNDQGLHGGDTYGPCPSPSTPPSDEPSTPPSDEPSAPPSDEPSAPPSDEPSAPPSTDPTPEPSGPDSGGEDPGDPTLPPTDTVGSQTNDGPSVLALGILAGIGTAAYLLIWFTKRPYSRRSKMAWNQEMDRDMDEHPEWFGMVKDDHGNPVERR